MKICPECHKISKDDDFCSHCGAAVFGFDDYSESARCNDYRGHDHNKVTYDRTERGTKIHERSEFTENMTNALRGFFTETGQAQNNTPDLPTQRPTYDKREEAFRQYLTQQGQSNGTDNADAEKMRKYIRVVFIFVILMFIIRALSESSDIIQKFFDMV